MAFFTLFTITEISNTNWEGKYINKTGRNKIEQDGSTWFLQIICCILWNPLGLRCPMSGSQAFHHVQSIWEMMVMWCIEQAKIIIIYICSNLGLIWSWLQRKNASAFSTWVAGSWRWWLDLKLSRLHLHHALCSGHISSFTWPLLYIFQFPIPG